jgi:nitrogen-specific signal transduction histidine kinase
MESLGQAITSVAHYIKNVLACIDGSSIMVEKAIEQQCYEALPQAWSVFKNSNRKVNALVQDMLILAKERVPTRSPLFCER